MSFEIARSGISAVNQSLDTISNNIANSGTYGYKSSRSNFSAMYSGSQANGAEVTSVSQSISQSGGLLNTGSSMDAMIQGRGFFAVKDDSGQQVYTRVGIFSVDKDGYVLDSLGRNVQGYSAVLDASGKPVSGAALGAVGDLKLSAAQIGAQASDKLQFNGNLSRDWAVPTTTPFSMTDPTSFNSSVTTVVYDSLGSTHSVTQYFIKQATPANTVAVQYSFDGGTPTAGPTLSFDSSGLLPSAAPTGTLTIPATAMNGAAALSVTVEYTGTTQYGGDTTTLTNAANGNAAGTRTSTAISEDGSIIATYSNGQKLTVGTLALVTFPNESALVAVSDTSWSDNAATGSPLYAAPGSALASMLTVGAVEQSNVDLTGELVNLMSAQRNYQANTKVISAESEMIQNLMQAV